MQINPYWLSSGRAMSQGYEISTFIQKFNQNTVGLNT